MLYELEVPTFGQIEVFENARSSRVSLRIYPGQRIRVSVPTRTSANVIKRFLTEHTDEITRLLKKAQSKEPQKMIFTPDSHFRTHDHDILFAVNGVHAPDYATARFGDQATTIFYPSGQDFNSESFQTFVHKVIDATLRHEAEKFLPARTAELAQLHGLKFSHVDLRNMRTQWGSCSSSGRICLNIQLMRLPDELIDLVILHELTHTLHMDHSKAFYADLDKFLGGRHAALNKALKGFKSAY